jgi:hypothetical protein
MAMCSLSERTTEGEAVTNWCSTAYHSTSEDQGMKRKFPLYELRAAADVRFQHPPMPTAIFHIIL